MARHVPSNCALPPTWSKEHDHFICHCEARIDIHPRTMVKALKKKYAAFTGVVITSEAIETRIRCLELMRNDYFKSGMELAVERLEGAGYDLGAMDLEKYEKSRITQEGYGDEGTKMNGTSLAESRGYPTANHAPIVSTSSKEILGNHEHNIEGSCGYSQSDPDFTTGPASFSNKLRARFAGQRKENAVPPAPAPISNREPGKGRSSFSSFFSTSTNN